MLWKKSISNRYSFKIVDGMFNSRINETRNVVVVMEGKYVRLPTIEAKNIAYLLNKDDARNLRVKCNLQIFGLGELRDSAKNMFDNISDVSLDIGNITKQMTSTLEDFKALFAENNSLVGLGNKICGIVLQMILTPKDRVIQTLASSIIGAFGFQIASYVYSIVGKHMFQFDNTTEILASLLMLAFQFALGLPKDFNPKTLLSFFSERGRNFKFALEGFNSMKMFVDNIIIYIQEKLGIFKTDSELEEYCSGYNDWVDGIKSIVLSHPDPLVKRLETSEELWFYIDELYKKALEYSRAFGEKRLPMTLNIEFQKMFKIIEDAKRQCDASGTFGNKPRIEPLVVHLFGESGVGKSGMSWPLAVDLNALFCSNAEEAEEFAKNIYFRNTEQEFWDGYAGQNVVCYDDFGQRVDGLANPNEEFMELIRCSNMAPYPLHMADIIDKRRTKFTSKVIILTSNVLNQQVNSLTFPDAYRRRIDVCGQVSVKDEYAYQAYSKTFGEMRMRLDPTKTDSVIDTKVYEVTLYDAESEAPILDKDNNPIVLDYDEFVTRCIRASRTKIQRGTEINKVLSSRMTESRFKKLKAALQISMSVITKRIADGTIEVFSDCYESTKDFVNEYLDKDVLYQFISERRAWIAGITATFGLLALLWSKFWSNEPVCDRHKIKKRSCNVCHEMTHSGDASTMKKVHQTEITHSGDSLTQKKKVQTEMTHSGDALTQKKKYVVEMTKSGDDITGKRKIHMEHSLTSDSDKIAADMQAWEDCVAQDLISTRILSNLYKIIRVGESDTPLMNGLFVRDTIMLLPRHIQLGLSQGDIIRIENIYGSRFEIPLKDIKQVEINGRDNTYKDAMLWQFPRHVNSHCDLVKHFQKMPELSARRANVCLPTLRSLKDELVVYIHGNTDASVETVELSTTHGDFLIRDSLRYRLNTTFGDCGSPVVCNDRSVLRKICGIHIAGETSGASAFAQSVTQQDLISHLSLFDAIITDPDQMANIAVKSDLHLNVEFDKEITTSTLKKILNMAADTFYYIGKCTKVVFTPNKTELRKSIIHGKVSEPSTKPAFLSSNKCNILHKNLEKCGMNTPYIPKEEIEEAVSSYKPLLLSNKRKHLCRVLTNEEAISGSTDSEFMNGIARGSSPGYPYIFNKESGKKGKTSWFGEDGEYVYSKEILDRINHLENIAKQGKRIPFIWTDTLKDERRPIAKVDALKTRVFAAGPMDFTLLIRKYFLGFVANTMENRIDNEQSLGTNPFGSDWDRTARKLNSKGKKVFAGDFSTFDGTLNPGIMNAFVDVVNEWYNDGKENAILRKTLFLDVMNSVHLCGDQFYGTTHSQPSGNPLTTILNSWYNSVSMRIAYKRAAIMAGIRPPQFNSVVSMVSYGDDNVINLSDSIADWFNQITVSEAYSTFGMTYTDEGKTGELIKYKTLSEVAYLKRGFRYADGHCFAPLELGVCLEMCNWIRNSPDPIEQCEANIASAARELTQHGEEVFNTWVPRLVRAFYEETNKYPVIGTYRFYIDEIIN